MVLDSMLNIIAYEDSWLLRIGSWYFPQQSPTFKFWLLVHKYQQIIFIRANRERKLELMVSTLHLQRLTALQVQHASFRITPGEFQSLSETWET